MRNAACDAKNLIYSSKNLVFRNYLHHDNRSKTACPTQLEILLIYLILHYAIQGKVYELNHCSNTSRAFRRLRHSSTSSLVQNGITFAFQLHVLGNFCKLILKPNHSLLKLSSSKLKQHTETNTEAAISHVINYHMLFPYICYVISLPSLKEI